MALTGSDTSSNALFGNLQQITAQQAGLSPDDIDLIIALGMAKEGFDWPWCEHALTIGEVTLSSGATAQYYVDQALGARQPEADLGQQPVQLGKRVERDPPEDEILLVGAAHGAVTELASGAGEGAGQLEALALAGGERARVRVGLFAEPDPVEGLRPSPYPAPADLLNRRMPLGTFVHARSGDKGGNANVGVWVRDRHAWAWLESTLTVDELRRLLPETRELPVERYELPNLGAVNVLIRGLLGQGVAAAGRAGHPAARQDEGACPTRPSGWKRDCDRSQLRKACG